MPSIKEMREKAASYFMARPSNFPEGRPYNCCESVLLALAEYLDIKSDLIPRIAMGIDAGVSLNGLLCGSISGSVMAIGIKHGRKSNKENPKKTWSKVDKFLKTFKDKWGATNCRELTGLDVKTAGP